MFVNCRDGCGTFVEFDDKASVDETTAELVGQRWVWLESAGKWRCFACNERLSSVIASIAANPEFVDTLDPKSRGALPRNTAITIVPPANVAAEANGKLSWD